MPDPLQTLIMQVSASAIISGAVAWLTATLTARLTLQRFYKERMWERKATAYTTILEALYLNQEWYSEHFDAAITHQELTQEHKEKLTRASSEARSLMMRSVEGQTWLLSPEVGQIIANMEKALDQSDYNPPYGSWEMMLDNNWGVVRNARDQITALARRDLSIAEKRSSGLLSKAKAGFARVKATITRRKHTS